MISWGLVKSRRKKVTNQKKRVPVQNLPLEGRLYLTKIMTLRMPKFGNGRQQGGDTPRKKNSQILTKRV
jgi:hypothetical protein